MEPHPLRERIADLHGACHGWALACCGRVSHEAEEVLQDSYEKVLSGRARFDARSSLKTWLFGVIRRTALERRRRSAVRGRALTKLREAPAQPEPELGIEARERAAALDAALRALSDRQREVLHLVFYEGMTIEQASEVMAVSVGTARQHYERGKARLRGHLAELGEHGHE